MHEVTGEILEATAGAGYPPNTGLEEPPLSASHQTFNHTSFWPQGHQAPSIKPAPFSLIAPPEGSFQI